jgi:hypothetical protein
MSASKAYAILLKVESGGALSEFSIPDMYPVVNPVIFARDSEVIFSRCRNLFIRSIINFSSLFFVDICFLQKFRIKKFS